MDENKYYEITEKLNPDKVLAVAKIGQKSLELISCNKDFPLGNLEITSMGNDLISGINPNYVLYEIKGKYLTPTWKEYFCKGMTKGSFFI